MTDGEQLARLLLDTLPVVEQHDGAVRGDQRAVRILREVLVPGRVQQVDPVTVVVELQHARRDRDAALLLQLHPVGRRVTRRPPRLHRSRQVDRAAVQQQLLGERRLAGVGVADDGKGAAARHGRRVLGRSGSRMHP
jgi:hypothetical protein